MNELRRMAYLQAMGTDSYISRAQLPAAATTHRLVVVRECSGDDAAPFPDLGQMQSPPVDQAPAAGEQRVPRIEIPDNIPRQRPAVASPGSRGPAASVDPVPRFSLVAIVVGDWLWLEELGASALATQQLQLVQAMAHALAMLGSPDDTRGAARPNAARPDAARPEQAQFNWPIHNNQQLDLGMEAARSSVAGFVQRKLDQYQCTGLVLLGSACEQKVPLDQLDCDRVLRTHSSADMLADMQLKKQAWADLRA